MPGYIRHDGKAFTDQVQQRIQPSCGGNGRDSGRVPTVKVGFFQIGYDPIFQCQQLEAGLGHCRSDIGCSSSANATR